MAQTNIKKRPIRESGKKKSFGNILRKINIRSIWMFNVLVCITGLVICTFGYMVGFHNMDLGQNMRYLESEFNVTLSDRASDGKYYDSFEMYNMGTELQRISFFSVMPLSFILGIALTILAGQKDINTRSRRG